MTIHHFDDNNCKPDCKPDCKPKKTLTPSKMNFLLGLFAGMALLSTVTLVILLGVVVKNSESQENVAGEVIKNVNTNNNPTPSKPTQNGDPSKLTPIGKNEPVRGNKNAKVSIIEYSDFECPFCRRHNQNMERLMEEYGEKVKLVFRQFPLSFHKNAQKAAEASECATDQGKFWEMHDAIFEASTEKDMSIEKWKKTAKKLGMDTSKFNDCLDSGKKASKISNDMNTGSAAGVKGTPATFINGEMVSGAVPYEQIKAVLESKL